MSSENKIIRTRSGRGNYIWNYEELGILSRILINIKSEKEINDLLVDLLTPRELSDILRRLLIAYAINCGFTFKQLEEKCGVNPNTVSQLRKKIYFGNGKLKEILENLSIDKIDKELDGLFKKIRKSYKTEDKDHKPIIYSHK